MQLPTPLDDPVLNCQGLLVVGFYRHRIANRLRGKRWSTIRLSRPSVGSPVVSRLGERPTLPPKGGTTNVVESVSCETARAGRQMLRVEVTRGAWVRLAKLSGTTKWLTVPVPAHRHWTFGICWRSKE